MRTASLGKPLATLYVLAGLPLGIFTDVVPVYLRSEGLSLGELGSYSALYLPYSCKALIAPAVDRTGRQRRWLMACGTLLACAYGGLAWASAVPSSRSLAWALALMTTASALYDIALDATFANTLVGASPKAHGSANAWRLSAFKSAMVLAGSVGVLVGGAYGFAATFAGVGLLHAVALCCVPFARFRDAPPQATSTEWLAAGARWLRAPATWHAVALAFAYKLSIATLLWVEKTFWLDRGLSLHDIGIATALTGLTGTVAGANLGSRLTHRYGMPALLLAGLLMQAALGGAYCALTVMPASAAALGVGLVLSGLTFGLSTAALMNFITQLCQPQHAATQFAALTGCYALARSLGGILAGQTADACGYKSLFALVALLPLPAALLVAFGAAPGANRPDVGVQTG